MFVSSRSNFLFGVYALLSQPSNLSTWGQDCVCFGSDHVNSRLISSHCSLRVVWHGAVSSNSV